jgi:hypothetical protein
MEEERDKGKRVSALVVDEDEEIRGTLMERLQGGFRKPDISPMWQLMERTQ